MEKKEKLIRIYEQAGFQLLDLLKKLEDGPNKRNKERLLQQIAEILNTLTGNASELAAEILSEAYSDGSNEAIDTLVDQGIEKVKDSLKSMIHQRAVQEIVDDCFYSILEATDHMSEDIKERIEEVIRRANQRILIDGVSRRQALKDAIIELSQKQITGMIYKNGTHMPADKYLAGVIQYYQRKAHVDGSINRIQENGVDLVYVNKVGITCDLCAQFQGRVYSISGNDSRFPRLEKKPPYHSHCVHSTSAWIEEYQGEHEAKRMIDLSNKPFQDTRTAAQIRRYNQIQREKARKNETRKQWIRYKGRMGDSFPSLKVFASQKARNTAKYQEWQDEYRGIGIEIKKREQNE